MYRNNQINRYGYSHGFQEDNSKYMFIGGVIIVIALVVFLIAKGKFNNNEDQDSIKCSKNDHGELSCECKPGFFGAYCERQQEECDDDISCNNRGKPYKKDDGQCVCDCDPDYIGTNCESKRNDIYMADCNGIRVCCKNGKICGERDLSYNIDCSRKCLAALDSTDPDVKFPKGSCMCGE